ncbi:hypothetical protein Taro_019002 [Colocasia esculenta]|uniref:Uncharacterized protein n=1 Tax=Colocasia esculenta TaxID=4460 RepID=A0A843UVG8_COLES|nr:hypothetical protein [Colocasia esculenta]
MMCSQHANTQVMSSGPWRLGVLTSSGLNLPLEGVPLPADWDQVQIPQTAPFLSGADSVLPNLHEEPDADQWLRIHATTAQHQENESKSKSQRERARAERLLMENEMGEGREVEVAGKKLLIHESRNTCDPATGRVLTGSWLWDSALHLSEWMAAAPPHHLADKTVLELGAGTGLPGLTAALLGAARVVLTDQAPLLPGLRTNAAVNGLADRVEVRELSWGTGGEDPKWVPPPDVVLMSDVFYDPDEMGGLAETLRRVCGEATVIWSASEVRESVNSCLELLAEDGFRVTEELSAVRQQLMCSPGESSEFVVFVIQPPRD